MLMDNIERFSASQLVTATAPSTFTYDILKGAQIITAGGTYAVPSNDIIGNAAFFGEDLGLGRGLGTPTIVVSTGAGTISGGTSLGVSLQGAADNGGGTLAGLTFVPYMTEGPVPLASLVSSARLCTFQWPPRVPMNAPLPRFINLLYTVNGSNFAGLTLSADVTLGPDTANGTIQQYPANF